MVIENYRYSVLYKLSVSLKINSSLNNEGYITLQIPTADIVSITMINDYDYATFPIIRLRLYTDLTNMTYLTENPDDINVSIIMNGNVYRMNDSDNKTPTPVSGATNINISLKGYIENKNVPTSIFDKYDHGIERLIDLNVVRKVPIELYCYDEKIIHYMRTRTESIYKDMTLSSIIETMFRNQGIINLNIDPMSNQIKYDQVLIPNLNINESLSFFDSMYGMYEKGAQLYGDIDKVYISNTDVNNRTTPLPIFVESYKNNSDMGGIRKINTVYNMNTKAENISVISETDIERVLNAEYINSINLNSFEISNVTMTKLFPKLNAESNILVQNSSGSIEKSIENLSIKYAIPDMLHKSKNKFIANTIAARIYEKVTRVDVSGVGFDIGKLKINTRYNLIFDSPIRGIDMNQLYRSTYSVHIFTNLDSDLFIAQTTMHLCNN